jgi:hypothetical protein
MQHPGERAANPQKKFLVLSPRIPETSEPKVTFFSPTSTVRHCLVTGERCVIERGPTWEDRRSGVWRYACPSCGAQHEEDFSVRALDRAKPRVRTIDVPIEVDLGELIHGHHVVARGLQLRTLRGSLFHYDCVPAIERSCQAELDIGWDLGEVIDDVGTRYHHAGGGTWGLSRDGTVNWGEKSLGNGVPATATTLLVRFRQANRGLPEDYSSPSLLFDLRSGEASVQRH